MGENGKREKETLVFSTCCGDYHTVTSVLLYIHRDRRDDRDGHLHFNTAAERKQSMMFDFSVALRPHRPQ